MWLLGAWQFLFLANFCSLDKMDQDGTTLQQVSRPYLSQCAMVKGHLRPWDDPKHTWTPPRTMLLGTVNPSHVPEGCQNTEHKTQSTYHGMANLHCKKLHLEKLRSEIKNSPVDIAPSRCSPISVPWTKWIKMAQPFTTCPGPTYLSMPW